MIEKRIVDRVSRKIYQQFPEMSGVSPSIRQPSISKDNQERAVSAYLLTYQVSVSLPGGKSMPRWVRVMVNTDGNILKISTSL